MPHLKITQALCVSIAVAVIGFLATFIPGVHANQQALITDATAVIAGTFLLANSLHALISVFQDVLRQLPTLRNLEASVGTAVASEVQRVNVGKLAQDAVDGKVNVSSVEKLVQGVLTKLALASQAPPPGSEVAEQTAPPPVA